MTYLTLQMKAERGDRHLLLNTCGKRKGLLQGKYYISTKPNRYTLVI